ncbi:MAG: PstC family ABC transporter permease [Microthrixaceae bacterium]|nr:phosphate ABC transporter permease subunit PstC [Microthrixaceae bacterium]
MSDSGLTLADLAGSKHRNRVESAVKAGVGSAASLSIVISVAILAVLIVRSVGFLARVEWSSLVSSLGWFPRSERFDLVTLLLGSLWVTGIALAVATPIGVGAAVYLSEYASKRVRRWLKPSVEILAGLPSVVVAYFILQVIYPTALEGVLSSKYTLLAAGLGVGILTIPIIASVTEDALSAVPNSLREASVGLGARKAVTTVRVVLPAAVSGITAALIVGASRALGETMLVTLVAGGANGSARAFGPAASSGGVTMTSAMANLAAGSDSVAVGTGVTLNPVNSLYVVGLVLFAFTLGLNMIGDRLVRRFRQSY